MRVHLPADSLRDVLAPVNAVVDEAIVSTTPDAFVVHASTLATGTSVTVTLPAESCFAYTPSHQAIGINVSQTTELLNCLAPTGPVRITTPPHSPRVTLSTSDARYRAHAIDPTSIFSHTDHTTVETSSAQFTIPSQSSNLVNALTAADLLSETITIRPQHTDTTVECTATGDTDDMTATLTPTTSQSPDYAATPSTYDVDTLQTMYDAVRTRTNALQFTLDNPPNRLHVNATHTDTDATTQYSLSAHETSHGTDAEG